MVSLALGAHLGILKTMILLRASTNNEIFRDIPTNVYEQKLKKTSARATWSDLKYAGVIQKSEPRDLAMSKFRKK